MPLVTYLPDGDIDLTALGPPNSEDFLSSNVRAVLEAEEWNNDSKFKVKDVQCIQAEVLTPFPRTSNNLLMHFPFSYFLSLSILIK